MTKRDRIVRLIEGSSFKLSAIEVALKVDCSRQYVYYVAAKEGLALADKDAPKADDYRHWETPGEEFDEDDMFFDSMPAVDAADLYYESQDGKHVLNINTGTDITGVSTISISTQKRHGGQPSAEDHYHASVIEIDLEDLIKALHENNNGLLDLDRWRVPTGE